MIIKIFAIIGIIAVLIFIVIITVFIIAAHKVNIEFTKKQKVNSKDKIIVSDTIVNSEYNYKNVIEKNSFCPCCFDDTSVHYIRYISWKGYLSDFKRITERIYLRTDDISTIDEINDCINNVEIINDDSDICNKESKWCRLYLECKKCNSKWISEPFLASTRPKESFIQTDICKYYKDNKKKKG